MKTIRLKFEAGWRDISCLIFNDILYIKSNYINFDRMKDKNCKAFNWEEFYIKYNIKYRKRLRKIHLQKGIKWIFEEESK